MTADVTPAVLAVVGLTANDKIYDTTTAAILSGAASANTFAGDDVSLTGTASANFADKNIGTGKAVAVTGFTLTGADAGNYQIAQPSGLLASISPATVTLDGLTAENKPYDGNTTAAVTSFGALHGVIGADAVSLDTASMHANFADPNIGSGKPVTITGLTLSGLDASNYILSNQATTADITSNSDASVNAVTTSLLTVATGVNGTADTALGAGGAGAMNGSSLNTIRPGAGPRALVDIAADELVDYSFAPILAEANADDNEVRSRDSESDDPHKSP